MVKRLHPGKISVLIAFSILIFCSPIYSQEAESPTATFLLNNVPDRIPPEIKIIAPTMVDGTVYHTEVAELEIIGEVSDESKIRFVSINTDIKVVNETGIFAKSITLSPGENRIQLKSMDEHNNIQNQYITVYYMPPVVTLADRINGESKYYGLLIGIDTYEDAEIPNLDNPVHDAQSVYQTITANYTFEKENVRFLKNPSRSEIIRELDELRGKITENDNLLIFYAGHGFWDEDAEIGYWLPSDASRKTTADWFRNSTLVNYLQAIDTRHTLLITDACFAGSIFRSRSMTLDKEVIYDRIYEIPSRKAMTSGAMTEVPDKSAFVKYLVQRLDDNTETYLSSEELFSSFRLAVISNSSVLPQYGEIQNVGNQGGDFIFLKRE